MKTEDIFYPLMLVFGVTVVVITAFFTGGLKSMWEEDPDEPFL